MVQELLDMQTGRVYRRAGGGEWEQQFVDAGGKVAALLANAPYVRAMADGSKVVSGSKILSMENLEAVMFVDSDMRSLIGRSFNQMYDSIALMNGDWSNSGQLIFGAVYDASSMTVNVRAVPYGKGTAPQGKVTVRINYIISAR